ncbi:MAG: hypothetical protein ACLP5H_23885 [Desulfomonilaceae bacterium]
MTNDSVLVRMHDGKGATLREEREAKKALEEAQANRLGAFRSSRDGVDGLQSSRHAHGSPGQEKRM